jgi:hypothetical protein
LVVLANTLPRLISASASIAHLSAHPAVSALAAAYRAGSLRPIEVVHACLAQIARWQPVVNAFAHVDRAGAIATAEASTRRWHEGAPLSPLDGVPLSVKDLLHVAGMPTRWAAGCWATSCQRWMNRRWLASARPAPCCWARQTVWAHRRGPGRAEQLRQLHQPTSGAALHVARGCVTRR